MYAAPCRCLGTPLSVEPGHCFTCGRDIGHAARLSREDYREMERPGLGALLEAVARTRAKMRPPAPRHSHRRVVITPAGGPSRALQTVRGEFSIC